MTTFPLTPEGAAEKIDELYALTDEQLAIEAKAIRTDFKHWVTTNFSLSAMQLRCLNITSDTVTDDYGSNCSICFTFKKDIKFEDPGPPTPSGYGKWTETMGTVKLITSPTGDTTATGEYKFKMVYKPE